MLPDILIGLLGSVAANYTYESFRKIIDQYLAFKNIRIEAADKTGLITELSKKAAEIRADDSPEEASRSTREAVEKQVTILEQERNRLVPIATREHWVALIFAIIAGAVFVIAIILAVQGTIERAIVTLVASVVPGFLSKVFYSREALIENRIKEISSDLRESEKVKERLELLEQALTVVPIESKESVVKEFNKKAFRK